MRTRQATGGLLVALLLGLGCSTEPPQVVVEEVQAGPVQAGPVELALQVDQVALQVEPLEVEPLLVAVEPLQVEPLQVVHLPLADSADRLEVVRAPSESWEEALGSACLDWTGWEVLHLAALPGATTGSVQLVAVLRCL